MQPHLLEGVEISRYRIESLVARGGMGLVYRARDMRLDRPVALKILSPDISEDPRFRERFVRESRLAAAVDHPHIIPIYEADTWKGLMYLAMRFVHGADLHSVLTTTGPLDRATTLRVLDQTASALDAAHRAGLVHRDVKPGNLLMSGATPERVPEDVHVYLTDFGLTKKNSSISGITSQGQFLGTLSYVAPEQIRGEDVDLRTDIYALACVSYEMLTGEPPFVRDLDAALLWAHISATPPLVTSVRPDLPRDMDELLASAMAKDREERPATCGEFVARLRAAYTGPDTAAVDTGRGARAGGGAVPRADPRPPHPSLPGGLPEDALPGQDASPEVSPLPRESSTVRQPWRRRGGDPVSSPFRRSSAAHAAPVRSGPRRRGRGRWLALALVLAIAAVLAAWRPWEGSADLVARELAPGFTAPVPADWERATSTAGDGYGVLAPQDWTQLFLGDEEALAQATQSDPDSVVGVYAAVAELDPDTPARLVDHVRARIPAAIMLEPGEVTEVAGREFVRFTGTLALGRGEQLFLHGVVAREDPRLLLIFFARPAVDDEWRPVFDRVIAAVREER